MEDRNNPISLQVRLDDNRKKILTELQKINLDLSLIYQGAINVLSHENIPNRINFAAHGIRELMKNLPKYIDAPIEKDSADLKTLATNLKTSWILFTNNQTWLTNLPWNSDVQSIIKNFLVKCEDFFTKSSNILLTKKERSRATLRRLSEKSSIEPMPAHIEEQIINRWKECWEYFTQIAHHQTTTCENFISCLISLEQILIDFLAPRVFENMDAILRIINEGENRAH